MVANLPEATLAWPFPACREKVSEANLLSENDTTGKRCSSSQITDSIFLEFIDSAENLWHISNKESRLSVYKSGDALQEVCVQSRKWWTLRSLLMCIMKMCQVHCSFDHNKVFGDNNKHLNTFSLLHHWRPSAGVVLLIAEVQPSSLQKSIIYLPLLFSSRIPAGGAPEEVVQRADGQLQPAGASSD